MDLQKKGKCHDLYFCQIRTFIPGNILSWESETWNLTSPNNSSQKEILDFEADVCSRPKVMSCTVHCTTVHGDTL